MGDSSDVQDNNEPKKWKHQDLSTSEPKLQHPKTTVVAVTTTSAATVTTTAAAPPPPPPHQIVDDVYEYWLSKVKDNFGFMLRVAPYRVRKNKDVVMVAVQNDHSRGLELQFASPELQNNKKIVLEAVERYGYALQFASPDLQNDKGVVITTIRNDIFGMGLQSSLRNDNVIAAVQQDSHALRYVPSELQKNKDIALAVVKNDPENIKMIHEDLKRDPDILVAVGMFDEGYHDANIRQQRNDTIKIVFSTRFSLDPISGSEATKFTSLFKKSRYIQEGNFVVYSPNAFDKKTCDPEWTRFDHPCRGTNDTCQYNNVVTDEGRPTDDCCWRYSFRSQLQHAKDTSGFMLQLVESGLRRGKVNDATLGMGQIIELDMAKAMNLKVFQVYRPKDVYRGYEQSIADRITERIFCKYDKRNEEMCEDPFQYDHIDVVTAEISRWYENQCQDMSVTVIHPEKNLSTGSDKAQW